MPYFIRKRLFSLMIFVLIGLAFISFSLTIMVQDLPVLNSLDDYKAPIVSKVISRDGEIIGEYYKERRYLLKVGEIPSIIIKSFISAEDERFFQHQGLDFQGIIRAAMANINAGKIVQGGSTITQQTAKSILKDSERSFTRKFKEAVLANKMEKKLSKKEILYIYLNQIYLGHGNYGVEAAARTYFKKNTSELSIAEAAILAGLVQAPSKYSPFSNPLATRKRQVYVLSRMLESGHINREEFRKAMLEKVKIYRKENINNSIAPYYVEHVRQKIMKKYSQNSIYKDGLEIHVAAHSKLSLKAKDVVEENLIAHSKRHGYRGPIESLGEDQGEFLKALDRTRLMLFRKKYNFFYLPMENLEDFEFSTWANFNYETAKRNGLFTKDRDLLKKGEKYEAVVFQIEEDKKAAILLIGNAKVRLPIRYMRWARKLEELKDKKTVKPIKFVTDSINIGDVVLVKVLHIPPEIKKKEKKTNEEKKKELVVVALEQEPEAQSSLISMEIKTGYVVAMVGGSDFTKSEYNRALQSERQPGSSFKPLLYAAAVNRGFTPASIILDSPMVFEDESTEGLTWIPENYEKHNYGDTTLFMALVKSRNIPTIKLLQEVQVPYLIDYARSLGVKGKLNEDLSLALGSNSMSLLDLTKIYVLFSNNGRRVEPVYILKILDRNKETIFEYSDEEHQEIMKEKWLSFYQKLAEKKFGKDFLIKEEISEKISDSSDSLKEKDKEKKKDISENSYSDRVISEISKDPEKSIRETLKKSLQDPLQAMEEKTAFILGDLLRHVVKSGTAYKANSLKRNIGGKTGTSNDFMDAWFIGFSSELVTGVWTGFDTPKSLGRQETGARAALPAWIDYMKKALTYYPLDDYKVPEGIAFVRINPKDGSLSQNTATLSTKVAFMEGSEPFSPQKERGKQRKNVPNPSNYNEFFVEDF